MQKIIKQDEPVELAHWRHQNPSGRYSSINGNLRQSIRKACVAEQKHLCAFCCSPISSDVKDSHNAHLKSQSKYPQLSLDWNNIVASCESANSCGKHQKNSDLPLTPLMDDCETKFKFYPSGDVVGLTDRATKTIDILNLNNPALKNSRKQAITALLYSFELYPPEEDIAMWDQEILSNVIKDCKKVDENGKYLPFSPILANICRHLIGQNTD